MATINLGNLTFTHRGDYAGGTAYVKNDVVYYATNGNSYIAKTSTTGNAPTSTAHWDLFVAGASGIWNAGLSLGSANQVVKVNSGGNALEFGDISAQAGSKAFAAFQSGSDMSALNNSANTELVFDGEKHDDDGLYNTSNGRYTPGVAGIYFVSSHVTVNDINGTGDDLYLKFLINGDQSAVAYSQTRHAGSGAPFTDFHATAVIKLTNNTDYISTWIYQDAGGARNPKQNLCWFYGFRLA